MSKLSSMLNAALKSRVSPLVPFQSLSLRRFSTEGVAPPPPQQDPPVDPFYQDSDGVVYGRVGGISRNTLKTDIMNLFQECNLSKDDIKVKYDLSFNPVGMMVQFSSPSAYDMALRQTIRKGRLYKLDKVDRSQWDILPSYDGKFVFLLGIPRMATPEDIVRLLSGTNFEPSFQISAKPSPAYRSAVVRFPTYTDAMNACRTKNLGFCLNNQIIMRVLQ